MKQMIVRIKSQIAGRIFKTIYRVYLWSSESASVSFLGSRSLEYPFVIEELKRSKVPYGGRILLVGCAGDPLSTILPALGYVTYGLDVKRVAVKYRDFHFVRGDIRKTDFPDEYFDAVVAVSTIEHVGVIEGDREGDKKAMSEIRRKLRPNGIIIITCPVTSRPKISTSRYERVYDLESLGSLCRGMTILTKKFFREDEEGWVECLAEGLPSDGHAIVLVSMTNKQNNL